MKLTKRVLSMLLAIAMLMTVATFPAIAADPEPILLEATNTDAPIQYAGAKFFYSPESVVTLRDTLALPTGNAAIAINATATSNAKASVISFAALQTGESILGLKLEYTNNYSNFGTEKANVRYVKIDTTTWKMTGLYAAPEDLVAASPTISNISFSETGKYVFAFPSVMVLKADGAIEGRTIRPNNVEAQGSSIAWAIDVVEKLEQGTQMKVGSVTTGTINMGTAAAPDDTYKTKVYVNALSKDSNGKFIYKAVEPATTTNGIADSVQLDFPKGAYIQSFSVNGGWRYKNSVYDVLVSTDGGETWSTISENNAVNLNATVSIAVNSYATNVRLKIKDYTNTSGTFNLTVSAVKGYLYDFPENSKNVELSASFRTDKTAGPNLIARPINDFVVGDSLSIPAGGIAIPDAHTATGMTGFILQYGTTINKVINTKLYAKVENNKIVSLHTSYEDMEAGINPYAIKFTETGKYVFAIQKYFKGNSTGVSITTNSFDGGFTVNTNAYRWAIDVNEPGTKTALPDTWTALSKDAEEITAGAEETNDIIANTDYAENKNNAYWVDVVAEGVASDATAAGYKDKPFTTAIRSQNGTSTAAGVVYEPAEGIRFDFLKPAYIKTVKFNNNNLFKVKYVVFGSYDYGKTWVQLKDPVTTDSTVVEVSVDAVVTNIRVDMLDNTNGGRYYGMTIVGATGILNVYDTEITFVDSATSTSEKPIIINKDGTVTVPDKFKTDYAFYTDADCTTPINLAAATFAKNTEIYAKKIEEGALYVITIKDVDAADGAAPIWQEEANAGGYPVVDEELESILLSYKLYTTDSMEELADLTKPVTGNTTFYAKKPAKPEVVYEGKTYNAVVNPDNEGDGLINKNKSSIPFYFPDADYFVGDTIVLPQQIFEDNTYTYKGTETVNVDAMAIAVRKYGSGETTYYLNSSGNNSFTFEEAGIYSVHSAAVYQYSEEEQKYVKYTDYSQLRLGIIEVKDYSASTSATMPVTNTNKESGSLTPSANVRYMQWYNNDDSATVPQVKEFETAITFVDSKLATGLQISANPGGANSNDNIFAGLVTDLMYDMGSKCYVESVSFDMYSNNLYEFDIYGSIDGTQWYPITDNYRVLDPSATIGWTTKTYEVPVDAVAQYVKLTNIKWANRCGGGALGSASAKGYTLADSEITESAVVVMPDGSGAVDIPTKSITKTVNGIEVTGTYADLPVPQPMGGKNYLVTGWQMLHSDGAYKDISLAEINNTPVSDLGNLKPVAIEVPFDLSALTADAIANEKDKQGWTANGKYINGLYIQGAQLSFDDRELGTGAGLRFINVVNNDVQTLLEDLEKNDIITNVARGTLAIGVQNGDERFEYIDLVYDNAKIKNPGTKLFLNEDSVDGDYYKYTLRVINFKESQYDLNIYVRPFLSFEYKGETVYLYGEQYRTSYRETVQKAWKAHENRSIPLTENEQTYVKAILGITE